MNIVENIERPERRYQLTIYMRSDGHFSFIESKLRQYGNAASFYRGSPLQSGIFGTEADVRSSVTRRLAELDEPAKLSVWEKRAQLVGMLWLHEWDPIGVKDEPYAQDEYDSYVGPIVSLLFAGTGTSDLIEHLGWIQYENMGLSRPAEPSKHLAEVAQKLIDLATGGLLESPP